MNSNLVPPRAPLTRLAAFAFVAALSAACSREPQLDVRSADSATTATPASADAQPAAPLVGGSVPTQSAAPPLAEGAALPANHPPMGMPAGHPPLDAPTAGAMQIAPAATGSGQGATALAWTAGPGWVSEPPSNSMRRAQYKVPGPGGDGECVVFYFGPGQGGDAMSNAERWATQFTDANGQPATGSMKTRTATVNGIEVLFVEAAGTYHTYQSGSMMGMGQGVAKPDWALLGAVAKGPDANWFFKLTAPKATLEANRVAFDAMVASLTRGS